MSPTSQQNSASMGDTALEDGLQDLGVPVQVQIFLWRQIAPFIRPKLGKLHEASCMVSCDDGIELVFHWHFITSVNFYFKSNLYTYLRNENSDHFNFVKTDFIKLETRNWKQILFSVRFVTVILIKYLDSKCFICYTYSLTATTWHSFPIISHLWKCKTETVFDLRHTWPLIRFVLPRELLTSDHKCSCCCQLRAHDRSNQQLNAFQFKRIFAAVYNGTLKGILVRQQTNNKTQRYLTTNPSFSFVQRPLPRKQL